MLVLAGPHDPHQLALAVLLHEGGEPAVGLLALGPSPLGRGQELGDGIEARVLGIGRVAIEQVAKEVDVVLVLAPVPGEAPGIDHVDEDQVGISRQPDLARVREQVAHDAATGIALDAMRARDHHQRPRRLRRPDLGQHGGEALAVRPLQRMGEDDGRNAGPAAGGGELLVGLGGRGGEVAGIEGDGHAPA